MAIIDALLQKLTQQPMPTYSTNDKDKLSLNLPKKISERIIELIQI